SYEPYDARFLTLFNSYYEALGTPFARPSRGALSRPDLATVLDYRRHVDAQLAALVPRLHGEDRGLFLTRVELGLHHEQQHQELILTDTKYNLALNPLAPAYLPLAAAPSGVETASLTWRFFDGGLARIGHDADSFAFDNECPRHTVYVHPFAL